MYDDVIWDTCGLDRAIGRAGGVGGCTALGRPSSGDGPLVRSPEGAERSPAAPAGGTGGARSSPCAGRVMLPRHCSAVFAPSHPVYEYVNRWQFS
jgi:hypothetical protein